MAEAPTVRIGVSGALGRMGRAVADVAQARPDARLSALFDQPGAAGEGLALPLSHLAAAMAASDVIIDFSAPAAAVALARACAAAGAPALVIGTTGLADDDEAAIAEAAETIAIVRSGNFSLGINLLAGLVKTAAAALGPTHWDIEIIEAHHGRKIDAPSGTAFMLGQAAAAGRNVDLDAVAERGRDGLTGPRKPGAIGLSAVRGGGVVGEHSVLFLAEDEIITLAHSARDRSLFARGAVAAAIWAAHRSAGLYDMMDVLGFGGTNA